MLNPVEGLAHEGILTKRVREEGGGYRFVFQAVAEYLIYRSLAESRPAEEAEPAYWAHRAVPARVFPEYAGAFAFLLRDCAAGERLSQMGPLVEASPGWLGEVLTTFLVEQARTGYVPGTGSLAAERIAKALVETGGGWPAYALHDAGYQQVYSRFARVARVYFQACVRLREALHAANPDHIEIANDLGGALSNLGVLLRAADQVAEAEAVYRRSVELGEALHAANPDNMEIKAGYAGSLCAVGRFVEAGRLVDAVLALVPENPYANQLRRYMAQQQKSLPPDTTKITLASTAHPRANPAEAARLNMQYQQDLARWKALSWWKRRRVPKPTPPAGI